jgi:hypothetical protein
MQRYTEASDYAGYDPYDALKSRSLKKLTAGSKWARIAVTQILRRMPVNLRPLLGICKGHNSKGIGLFLWGYSKLYVLEQKKQYLDTIDYLLDLLEALKCDGYSGNCWGYNFDWQSRTYYRPKGTPTIVNTSFIGHALLDCYALTGKRKSLTMALAIKDFLLKDLHRTGDDHSFCFSYTPQDTSVVHNANLLGASLLARLAGYSRDDALTVTVLASLQYSMQHQHEDGAWYYADNERQRWVDSFHTGFNLQAIRYILRADLAPEYASAYERGVRYYARTFFLSDGTPKYYNTSTYPIDIHAPAQAICFFSSECPSYHALVKKIVRYMIKHFYSGAGYFYFRKGRFVTNRIPYMRWAQAWAFHALTDYLLHCQGGHPHGHSRITAGGCHGNPRDCSELVSTGHGVYCRLCLPSAENILCGRQSREDSTGA